MFNYIILSSIITSAAIILLLVLQPLLRKIYTSSAIYLLWVCILLRFIIPFNIKIPYINFALNLDQMKPVYSQLYLNDVNNNKNSNLQAYNSLDGNLKTNSASDKIKGSYTHLNSTNTRDDNKTTLTNILIVLWLSAAFLLLMKIIVSYILFTLSIKKHGIPLEDNTINDYIREIRKEMKISRSIRLIVYRQASAPQLFGLFKPIIIFPEVIEDREMLQFVIRHELTHYKRGDLFVKILSLSINAFYWFNPLTYVLKKNLDLYCELSCDECIVKNTDVNYRQRYGETILNLMRNSIRQNTNLSTCFYSSKKILERRLFVMMDIKKKHTGLLFIVAAVCAIGIFGGFAKQSDLKTASTSSNSNEKTVAAVVRNNELDLINLKSNNNITMLDNGGMFSNPIISPNKNYVAYIKDTSLYVSTTNGTKWKVLDNASAFPYTLSYTWLDNTKLIYSIQSGGLYIFDAESGKSTPYVKNEFNYKDITIGTNKDIYAEKYRYYKKDNTTYIDDYGVVLFPSNSKEEQLIIKSIPSDSNNLGMYPVITGISKDLRFLYILEHPHSASTATDGMDLAFYDTKLNKYIKSENNNIFTLGYTDNFSSCSDNSELLALINGGGREMNSNKTLGILNITNGQFESLLPQGIAAMTPYYSSDCKNILYAASDKSDGIDNLRKWMQAKHSIYSINVETKKITQLTNSSDGFDFDPVYINDKDITFLRSNSDGNVSMWELKNGVETKLIDNLIFYNDQFKTQNFYGHFDTNNYIDIK